MPLPPGLRLPVWRPSSGSFQWLGVSIGTDSHCGAVGKDQRHLTHSLWLSLTPGGPWGGKGKREGKEERGKEGWEQRRTEKKKGIRKGVEAENGEGKDLFKVKKGERKPPAPSLIGHPEERLGAWLPVRAGAGLARAAWPGKAGPWGGLAQGRVEQLFRGLWGSGGSRPGGQQGGKTWVVASLFVGPCGAGGRAPSGQRSGPGCMRGRGDCGSDSPLQDRGLLSPLCAALP